jgi:uncharacterized repeat protein (TIGR01451 family)
MSTMVWKAAALVGVMAGGGVVVWQAQKSLQNSTTQKSTTEDEFPLLEEDGSDPAADTPLTSGESTDPASGDDAFLAANSEPQSTADAAAELERAPAGSSTETNSAAEAPNPFAAFDQTPASDASSTAEAESATQDAWGNESAGGAGDTPASLAGNSEPSLTSEDGTEGDSPTVAQAGDEVTFGEPDSKPLRRLSPDNNGPILRSTPDAEPASEPVAEGDNPFGRGGSTASPLATDEDPVATAQLEESPFSSFNATPRSSVPPDEDPAISVDSPRLEHGPAASNPKSSIPARPDSGLRNPGDPGVVQLDDPGLESPQSPGLPAVADSLAPAESGEVQDEPTNDFAADRGRPTRQPASIPDIPSLSKVDHADGQQDESRAIPAAGEGPPFSGSSLPPITRSIPTEADDSAAAPRPLQSVAEEAEQPDLLILDGAAPPQVQPRTPDLVGDGIIDRKVTQGPSQPQLTINKQAPSEAVVGQDLEYSILVKNVGRTAAHNVVVEDQIPRGSECTGTSPKCEAENKKLIWKLGTMEAGSEQLLRVRVMPTTAGEIGSIATVSFSAEVAARTTVVEPKANLIVTGPTEVVAGDAGQYRFVLNNSGSVDLKGVFIRTILPEGLGHSGGRDLEYEVGDLPRGQSREVKLSLQGLKPGAWQHETLITHHGRELTRTSTKVNVIESRIVVSRTGPAKRFVGRPAAFTNTVTNSSNRELVNVTVTETIPQGVELTTAPKNGHWDPARRTISWLIPRLPAGAEVELPTTVVAKKDGLLQGRVAAADANGNKAEVATSLEVAGFSALEVDFARDGRPVPVGEQASVRFSVKNKGSAAAEQVTVVFELPEEVKFINAHGPTKSERVGNLVTFEPVSTVAANGSIEFDVVFEAVKPTPPDRRVRVSLHSSQLPKDKPLEQEQQLVIFGEEPLTTGKVEQASGTAK